MAKKTINIGINPDDGTGDLLRDAFDKVNDNFNELYDRTGGDGVDAEIDIDGNTITTTTTNTDLILDTNGTGQILIKSAFVFNPDNNDLDFVVNGDTNTVLYVDANNQRVGILTSTPAYALDVSGQARITDNVIVGTNNTNVFTINSRITGNVVPTASNTYDLGTSALKWKDLYISGSIETNQLIVSNAGIAGGSINSTAIGNSIPSTGSFTTLFASNSVDFSGATVTGLGIIPNIDINGGTIDSTTIGASSPSTGAFTTLDSTSATINTLTIGSSASFPNVITNQITGQVSNSDINLSPTGFGNVAVNSDLTVTGDVVVAGDATVTNLTVSDLFIDGEISTATTNTDITLTPNGTGRVLVNGTFNIEENLQWTSIAGWTLPGTVTAHIFNGDMILDSLTVSFNEISTVGSNDNIILNPNGTGYLIVDSNTIQVQPRTIASSIGDPGDLEGMIVFDSNYQYYCTADYDGSTSIWRRTAWAESSW